MTTAATDVDIWLGNTSKVLAQAGQAGKEGLAAVRLEFEALCARYQLAVAVPRLLALNPRTQDQGRNLLALQASKDEFRAGLLGILARGRNKCKQLGAAEGKKEGKRWKAIAEHFTRLEEIVGRGSKREFFGGDGKNTEEQCEDCGTALIRSETEGRCPLCQRLHPLYNVECSEENQSASGDGRRARSGCFSPNRHHSEWLERIQALEADSEIGNPNDPDDLNGEKLIATLKAHMKRTGEKPQLLTIDKVRQFLITAGRTELNRNAALILKKLSGKGPPTLTEAQRIQGGTMFSQVIHARSNLPNARANRNYYPYYILKIYDLILARDDPARRLFCYIHLQGSDTLACNDTEWRLICKVLDWEYRSTDKAKIAAYATVFG